MKKTFSLLLALVAFVAWPHAVSGAAMEGSAEPEYCYRCAASLPSDTGNYPCMVCWHPVTGAGAVKSCIPYCDGTCSVGIACGEQALRGSVVQPDGSRLNLALSIMLQREFTAPAESGGQALREADISDGVVRDCGHGVAAEPVTSERLVQRLAALEEITI